MASKKKREKRKEKTEVEKLREQVSTLKSRKLFERRNPPELVVGQVAKPAPEEERHIIRTNAEGYLECVDQDTGGIIWREKRRAADRHKKYREEKIPMSMEIWQQILQQICEGESLKTILAEPGMPCAATVHRWRAERPEVEAEYEKAKKIRADTLYEQVLEVAHATPEHKDFVAGARLKMDAAVWAAEMANPDKYSKRTKITGDPNAPVSFILDTGIRRTGDPGAEALPELKKDKDG